MDERRWLSAQVVQMLVAKKDYITAANIETADARFFRSISYRIAKEIAVAKWQHIRPKIEFERLLKTAKDEIAFHRKWESECLASCPLEDDWDLSTEPLKKAFAKTSNAREQLWEETLSASWKWDAARLEYAYHKKLQ